MANLLIELYSLRRKVDYAENSQSTQAAIWSITANWVTTSFYQFSAYSRYSERPTQLNLTRPVLKMFRTSQTGKKLSDFQFFS